MREVGGGGGEEEEEETRVRKISDYLYPFFRGQQLYTFVKKRPAGFKLSINKNIQFHSYCTKLYAQVRIYLEVFKLIM